MVVTMFQKIKFIDSVRFTQLHYQISLIISQKKLTKLKVKIVAFFLNMKVLKTTE